MPKRAIALLRVSSGPQAAADKGGLPRQREAIEWIARVHELEVVEPIELEGISGASVLDDPRYQRMLDRLRDPEIHGVIVDDVTRLMRPEKLSDYQILEAFRSSGKLIYTREGARDIREFGGRLLTVLQGELGAHARSEIARWTREGRERKRRMGLRAEGANAYNMPRGIEFDHETGRWSYVEPGANQVRVVFRELLSGCTNFRELARRARIGHGAAASLSARVLSILRQPLYMGVYRVDRRWVKVDGKVRAVPRAPGDCHEHVVLDPPLVDPADWHRAQEILARREQTKPPRVDASAVATYHEHALCAHCGSVLWFRHGTRGRGGAYFCGNTLARTGTCAAASVAVSLADPTLDAAVAERLGSADALLRLLEAAAAEAARRRAPATDAARRLTNLHNRRARVRDAYESGDYDLVELRKRSAAIDGEIAAIEDRLGRDPEPFAVGRDVASRVARVFASWGRLGREEKRRLLDAYRVRAWIAATKRRHRPTVESIEVGLIERSGDSVRVYK